MVVSLRKKIILLIDLDSLSWIVRPPKIVANSTVASTNLTDSSPILDGIGEHNKFSSRKFCLVESGNEKY